MQSLEMKTLRSLDKLFCFTPHTQRQIELFHPEEEGYKNFRNDTTLIIQK
jgi:hypothetical protein